MRRLSLVCVLLLSVAGCHHAVVRTGKPPSNEVIKKSFAAGWIYGLVPPDVVATAERCPNGVARVETQLSFANQIVGILTLGIFTPMEIKVTCAAGGVTLDGTAAPDVRVSDEADVSEAFGRAADIAVREQRPVYVEF